MALAAAARALGTRYRTSLARLQLTYPQFQVMQVLWEERVADGGHAGGPPGPRHQHHLPAAQASRDPGPGSRRRDPRDERRVVITPTSQGLELRREEEAILRQVSLATRLTPAQERDLVRSSSV